MYETKHPGKNDEPGVITNIIWSDVFICPYCHSDIVFFDVAVKGGSVKNTFKCQNCLASLTKDQCEHKKSFIFDELLNENLEQAVQQPVVVNYKYKKSKYTKRFDNFDEELLQKINNEKFPFWVPNNSLKDGDNTKQPINSHGFTHEHHFYTKRNLYILGLFYQKISKLNKPYLISFFTSILNNLTKRYRYRTTGGGGPSGNLYIPSINKEINPIIAYRSKIKSFFPTNRKKITNFSISTQSATGLENIANNSIDYIFTDPPFGSNIMYSEMSIFWESWIKIYTNDNKEAIINRSQDKQINDYQKLMMRSFSEFYRILKPKRWITVEFNNSKSVIWNLIQDTLLKSGFIIAQVSILDKKQGSFKQVTSVNSAKNDLIINAYKPAMSFEKQFLEFAGEGLEEEFIKMHLSHLKAEPTVERTEQMLYSKLLAYYVQRSYTVKYDSSTFYKMLRENFTEDDSYWFNKDQLANYREYKQKMRLEDIDEIKSGQMVLFIQDEKSAIIWLNSFLNKPKDFQEIHPAYTKIANIAGDNVPDIKELLDKNFILENGKYRRPQSEDEKLSVTEKRERELQREFDALLVEAKGSKKKIKECRKQAVIYGFEQCYKKGKFKDILALAARLNQKIIENDSEITEFIEVAEFKVDGF